MIVIRPEAPGDAPVIHELVRSAFASAPVADGSEQDLVDRLRARGELALSLAAVDSQSVIVGHIGFSPVTIGGRDCDWLQMAPVSVSPPLQKQGIGSTLIRAGVKALRQRGVRGIGVLGNPAYYERFGFERAEGFGPGGHGAEYFRAMILRGEAPRGELRYASAFYD